MILLTRVSICLNTTSMVDRLQHGIWTFWYSDRMVGMVYTVVYNGSDAVP